MYYSTINIIGLSEMLYKALTVWIWLLFIDKFHAYKVHLLKIEDDISFLNDSILIYI